MTAKRGDGMALYIDHLAAALSSVDASRRVNSSAL